MKFNDKVATLWKRFTRQNVLDKKKKKKRKKEEEKKSSSVLNPNQNEPTFSVVSHCYATGNVWVRAKQQFPLFVFQKGDMAKDANFVEHISHFCKTVSVYSYERN